MEAKKKNRHGEEGKCGKEKNRKREGEGKGRAGGKGRIGEQKGGEKEHSREHFDTLQRWPLFLSGH